MVGLKVGEGRGLHDLGGDALRAVREAMLGSGSSPVVVNDALADLRGVTRVAFDMGLAGRDEVAAVQEVRDVLTEKDSPTRVLSAREISALIAACVRDRSARGARDAAMILAAYAGGMFSRELCALDLGSWDPGKALLFPQEGSWWREGKCVVPLGANAQAAMGRSVVFRGRVPGRLFLPVDRAGAIAGRSIRAPTADRVLLVRAGQAGIEGVSYEDLHMTALLDAYAAGAGPAEVKRIFGYSVARGATYRAFGSGRPILLLHDSLGSSYSWRLVAPTLASSRRVYAYDLLGHGASEKPDGADFSIRGQAASCRSS